MNTFTGLTEPAAAAADRCVDRQLWLACAGRMCTVPSVGASVYYFPQGHAEHALGLAGLAVADDLSVARVPALVPCRVVAVRYLANPDTDEVFARTRLVPLRGGEADASGLEDDDASASAAADEHEEKPATFVKTLTKSDAKNAGGFSVPRYSAENTFPRLDYAADPPVQILVARDVHRTAWNFRHIYRGNPRRHLLTTGWSTFLSQKKLVAGDSVVFLRGDGGDDDLHVGIRRARRGGGGEDAPTPGSSDHYAGLMRDGNVSPCAAAMVRPEDVAEAARRAAAGQPFEVVYHPRASTPEFCVRAAAVRAAMRVQWSPGLRFKMAFEAEDSCRIRWFVGTATGVQVTDPIRWPQSPWQEKLAEPPLQQISANLHIRLCQQLEQVTWDEPADILQNVKQVNPWLVELVSSMPIIHLACLSPPRKKPRIPAYSEFPLEGQKIFNPAFPPNPLPHGHQQQLQHFLHAHPPFFPFPDGSSAPAAIQGAWHEQFVQSLSDLHLTNLQSSLLYPGLHRPDHAVPTIPIPAKISTDLTIGGPAPVHDDNDAPSNKRKPDADKPAGLVLFGRTILTEQQMSFSCSNASEGSCSGVIQNSPTKIASSERLAWFGDDGSLQSQQQVSDLLGFEPGQCKVFVESDTIGRNLDLSVLTSFDELYGRLSEMFGIEDAELRGRVLYHGAIGEVKHASDEPFSDFVKSARRLTILTDAGSDNLGS